MIRRSAMRSSSMLLAIDAGNTNITIAVFEHDQLRIHWRLKTDTSRTGDEYGSELRNLFWLFQIDQRQLEAIVIASVVPALNRALDQLAQVYCLLLPVFVDHTTRT